jgi:hypothetical protein
VHIWRKENIISRVMGVFLLIDWNIAERSSWKRKPGYLLVMRKWNLLTITEICSQRAASSERGKQTKGPMVCCPSSRIKASGGAATHAWSLMT